MRDLSADDTSSNSAIVSGDTQGGYRAKVVSVLLRRVERAEGKGGQPASCRALHLSFTKSFVLTSCGDTRAAHGVAKSVFHWWGAYSTRRGRAREARGSAADWASVQHMADCLREGCGEEPFRQLSLNSSVIVAHYCKHRMCLSV